MAIDPMQVIAMQQALAGGQGGGLPGAYGAVTPAYGGGQLAPQGFGSFFRNVLRQVPTVINAGRQLGLFGVDPLTAAYASGQLAPQGFGGGQLAPFGVDPLTAAYASGQLAPQGIFGSMLGRLVGGIGGRAVGGLFGN